MQNVGFAEPIALSAHLDDDAINLITQDTNAGWCDLACGQIINGNDGSTHCVVHMPKYVAAEEEES